VVVVKRNGDSKIKEKKKGEEEFVSISWH